MFEFTVPEGDYDYDPKTGVYTFKDLVFTEKLWEQAKEVIEEYVEDGAAFLVNFTPDPEPITVEVDQDDLSFILRRFLLSSQTTEIERVVYDRLMEKINDGRGAGISDVLAKHRANQPAHKHVT